METKSETYNCTYVFSADQQNEVRKILEKYLPHDEDKMEQLRKLDRSVARPGIIVSLILGIIGGTLHGIGIRFVLTDAGSISIVGVITAIIGLLIICSAYPVYRIITKNLRRKVTPQIISLCQELLR